MRFIFLALILIGTTAMAGDAPSQYFVKFNPQVTSLSDAEARLTEAGFITRRLIPEIGAFLAAPGAADKEQEMVDAIRRQPGLLYIEKDRRHWHTTVAAVPADPLYAQQYGPRQIGAEQAWELTTGSAGVVVAVSDTGAELAHPDLKDQLVAGYNFIDNNADPSDKNGHGTHVAGIIGASANNGVGVAGLNWRVSIMPVRFLDANGSGTDSGGVDTILYAANHGARLVNASWGSSSGSSALRDAINYAFDHGALLVAAAGNNGTDNDSVGEFPGNYAPIAVAADDSSGNLASFSDTGRTTVALAAPGVNVLSSYLGQTWKSLSGTSMATPMVTGVGALILSLNPGLSSLELRNAILNSAVPRAAFAQKLSTGGEVSASKAVVQLSQGFQVWPNAISVGVGKTFRFSPYHAAAGAVNWSVSNPTLASIAADGTLTGAKAGTVVVTARDSAGAEASAGSVNIIAAGSTPPGGGCTGKRRPGATPLEHAAAALNMSLPLIAGWIFKKTRRSASKTRR